MFDDGRPNCIPDKGVLGISSGLQDFRNALELRLTVDENYEKRGRSREPRPSVGWMIAEERWILVSTTTMVEWKFRQS